MYDLHNVSLLFRLKFVLSLSNFFISFIKHKMTNNVRKLQIKLKSKSCSIWYFDHNFLIRFLIDDSNFIEEPISKD